MNAPKVQGLDHQCGRNGVPKDERESARPQLAPHQGFQFAIDALKLLGVK